MIVQGKTKFIAAPFSSEQELEGVLQSNAEYIFGPDSIYLPKSIIRTSDGAGTIPDGFVVDIAARRWFIVEAELAAHSVWNHIAPQVAKQIIAASQPASRRALTELVVIGARRIQLFERDLKISVLARLIYGNFWQTFLKEGRLSESLLMTLVPICASGPRH